MKRAQAALASADDDIAAYLLYEPVEVIEYTADGLVTAAIGRMARANPRGLPRAVYAGSRGTGNITHAGRESMDWRAYIHSDAEVLLGKPVIRGTRLAVDFLLGLLAAGWTEQQVLTSYPGLTPESLQAVFAFAAECVKDEALYTTANDAASC